MLKTGTGNHRNASSADFRSNLSCGAVLSYLQDTCIVVWRSLVADVLSLLVHTYCTCSSVDDFVLQMYEPHPSRLEEGRGPVFFMNDHNRTQHQIIYTQLFTQRVNNFSRYCSK